MRTCRQAAPRTWGCLFHLASEREQARFLLGHRASSEHRSPTTGRLCDMSAVMNSRVETARRHVLDGRRIVAHQKELVWRLAALGLDTSEAKETLSLFESSLEIFEQHLRELLPPDA